MYTSAVPAARSTADCVLHNPTRQHDNVSTSREEQLVPDDGEAALSDAASELDHRARDTISDLTDFEVRKPNRGLMAWRYLVAYFLLVLAIIVGITYAVRSGSPGSVTSVSLQESGDAGEETAPAVASTADHGGLLRGTWIMYTTGSDDLERHAFTVQFIGTDTGSVEIVEDTTEFDAAFEMKGDAVSFEFTRIRTTEFGDWSEMSVFEGTFATDDEIAGDYVRENWSCLADRNPPCQYESGSLKFAARLVREP
jgi:hypothetical protein